MINALLTSANKNGSSTLPEESFSSIWSGWQGNAYRSLSSRTLYEATQLQNQVDISLQGAASPSAITFTGTGAVFSNGVRRELQSGQFSIATDPMPMDQTLNEWREPGTSNTVRLFLGSLREKPELMRLCLRIEVPGALRVACSRHRRSDGALVAADILHDLNGRQLAHVNNDDEANPRTILFCNRSDTIFDSSGPASRVESSRYWMFQFRDPQFFRNWALADDRSRNPDLWSISTPTAQTTEYFFSPPNGRAGFRWTVQNDRIVQYNGGAAISFSEECREVR